MRPLTQKEKVLINQLLSLVQGQYKIPELIEPLDDGNMGTIRFVHKTNTNRKYAQDLIQVEYIDADQIKVIITLTKDNYNDLFELEFWKTNFDSLIEYPIPEKIKKL
jgi:hypothetical protein